ncbi:lysophospholipid acyltransferase family protein [Enterovirga aerilata]|uniref:Lysophospholipid acyltransferase family protein n=1 Tax=Enterovirga aerilata TaxID=2730920 RepID=A0A849I5J0_9HYPH|nr:lysophospholipid acyltransferase family protein [Enterovirga sp. DB1703]NNM72964.1 lysophospholipid acyltransferase family protein [Enterovirga sp. DB1703]
MGLLKRLGRIRATQEALGYVFARYLDLVRSTNRFVHEPADIYGELMPLRPFIGAMWHGQHFMAPYLRRREDRAASLVSRSSDGELNAIALRHLGVRTIRGSGARGRDQRAKGGAPALRAMLRALEEGDNMFLTADVPKIARRCGEGIVTLARLSGRPIVAVAVATSRRVEFESWDRASIGLPFGRGAIVAGAPIRVGRDVSRAEAEEARLAVERELDRVNARACALVGRTDPGANLRAGAAQEPAAPA